MNPDAGASTPLADLKVVEIEGSVAGGYAAKLLADQGAAVILVPRPGRPSDRSRADALALDGAKRVRPGCTERGLAELVAGADVVIESAAPDPLAPLAGPGGHDHARLVSVRISPFGRAVGGTGAPGGGAGPYGGWRSTDCTDYAASGHLFLTGDPGREPLQGPAHQPSYAAGLHAAIGSLAALEARRSTGRGQVVEVTHQETMVALHQFTLLRHTHNGDVLGRMGNRYAGPGKPIGLYPCGDGSISLTVPRDDQLERLLAAADLLDLLAHPDIGSTYDLMHHPTLLDEHLLPWLEAQEPEATVELLQDLRVPAAPVRTMAGLLDDPHLAARHVLLPHPDNPAVRLPRSPLRLAPLAGVGADVDPVVGAEADAGAGGEQREPDVDDGSGARERPLVARPIAGPEGPLAGLRVVDLTRVWAGPLATRILADLGADVVMVEAPWARGPAGIDQSSVEATHYYPDDDPGEEHWNRIGFVNKYGINKRSVALDLTGRAALAAFERLVAWADVVIENYSPRVMPQLGLGEGRLAELNPDLVYVTMPGYGRTGPAVDWVAYGPMIDSHAGLSVLQGYAGEVARKGGVAWPDPVAGLHAAFAVLAALAARRGSGQASSADRAAAGGGADGRRGAVGAAGGRARGRGQVVEVAQLEATIALVGHALAEYQLTGEEPRPAGNRHPRHAPQGVYPAVGDDRWLAVSVTDDAAWVALVAAAGLDPSWAAWSVAERRQHHDRIDRALSGWSSRHDGAEVAAALQVAGVAASPVTDAPAVLGDPHLAARDFFVALTHPDAGTHRWPRCAIRLSATPATYRMPAPRLGQHNDDVLVTCAGLDPAEVAELRRTGALAERPPD